VARLPPSGCWGLAKEPGDLPINVTAAFALTLLLSSKSATCIPPPHFEGKQPRLPGDKLIHDVSPEAKQCRYHVNDLFERAISLLLRFCQSQRYRQHPLVSKEISIERFLLETAPSIRLASTRRPPLP